MKHERTEISAPDGTKLVVEQWAPPDPPKFVVCIVHGNAEHIGRYAEVAEDLCAAGAFVFGMDRRGQGSSGGSPGHVEAFEVFASDLRHLLLSYEDKVPEGLPWFVFAHSAGGLVALLYLIENEGSSPLRGVVLSNPLIELALKVPPVTAFFGRLAASVVPKLTLASNIPAAFVARDPEKVKAYEADERRVPKVSTRWFVAMTNGGARVDAEVKTVTMPLLWCIGTGDQICSHEASERAFATLEDPEANDQTLKVFDGYFHELHNEPEPERTKVVETYVEWMQSRI